MDEREHYPSNPDIEETRDGALQRFRIHTDSEGNLVDITLQNSSSERRGSSTGGAILGSHSPDDDFHITPFTPREFWPEAELGRIQQLSAETISALFPEDIKELNLNRARDEIARLDYASYRYFLRDFENMNTRRHELPPEAIEMTMERGFALAKERQFKETALWEFCIDIDQAIQLNRDFNRQKPSDRSSTDKAFLSLQNLYAKYPEQADNYWEVMGQNGQTIEPNLLLDGISKMDYRPDVSDHFKFESLHALNYLLAFSNYRSALLKKLDFDRADNFGQTGHWLELIRSIYYTSQDWAFSEDKVPAQIIPTLKNAVKQQKGSYLLNRRAGQLLEEFQGRGRERVGYAVAFEISPGQLAAYRPDGRLALLSPEQRAVAEQLIESRRTLDEQMRPPQELIDAAVKQGDDYVEWTPPPELQHQWREWRQQYQKFLDSIAALTPLDVRAFSMGIKSEATKDGDQSMQDIRDFEYLMTPVMRAQIEKDFGIQLATLSLPEQYYFLKFVKTRNMQNAGLVQLFAWRFGRDGLRTFLSLEHDQDMGDKILDLADKYDEADIKLIFQKYGEIVDASTHLREYLRDIFHKDIQYSEGAVEKIIERLLQRGRDLLIKYADSHVDSESITKELELYRADILLFADTFRTLRATGKLSEEQLWFRDITDTELTTKSFDELIDSDKAIMRQMFVENRERDGYPTKLIEATRQKFESYLDNPEGQFYLLTHNGEIVAFVRFAPDQSTKRVHVDSLNVRPQIRQSSLGSALLKATLDHYSADGYIIDGEAYTKNPMLKHYLSDFGFHQIGEPYIYPGTNESFVKLERLPEVKV